MAEFLRSWITVGWREYREADDVTCLGRPGAFPVTLVTLPPSWPLKKDMRRVGPWDAVGPKL